ncbi:MAG TPA: SIMPL domain-containing protein [Burkholderiaceae bacterium]|nr:SIMPL domain-containing protein [Burkholderiaceae bacterium]
MNNSLGRWVVALVVAVLSGSVFAHDDALPGTVVQLRAQADVMLENDEAQIIIYAQEQNADRAIAANAVNTKMKDAIARIKTLASNAVVRSSGYNTMPSYGPQSNKIVAWMVRQEFTVTTKELSSVDKLVASVQSLVNIGAVQFSPSQDTLRKAQDVLVDKAFNDLRMRIAQVARNLGKTPADATIEAVDFSGHPVSPAPKVMMSMRSAQAEVAPPRFEPGDTQSSLSFDARVRFK